MKKYSPSPVYTMLHFFLPLLVFVIPLAFSWSQPMLPGANALVGIWQGTLSVGGGMELRIVLHVNRESDGSLKASLDSPDQGASGIPVDSISLAYTAVTISMQSIAASYTGSLSGDRTTIDGRWNQGGASLPVTFRRVEKAPEVLRPQEPIPPYPYNAEEVTFPNTEADITLAGTLTYPKNGDPFPAVILISGSGPEDRNETVFGHRPFLVIADYLTRQGIAVLRVDDRGVGKSTGNHASATTEDFASDVKAGLRYLRQRKEIDHGRIGLAGHSEGGLIAPMVAAESPEVAFIVLLAGPGLKGEEILYLQADLISRTEGGKEDEIRKNRGLQKKLFDVIKEETDTAVAGKRIRAIIREAVATMSEEEKSSAAYTEAGIEQQTKMLLSPWFRYFMTYDPVPVLRKVSCPVLALIGEKDLQVPPRENLEAIGDALKAGGNPDVTLKELPGLNHLFQTAKTGSPTEYAKIEETFSPTALKIIADWILERRRK